MQTLQPIREGRPPAGHGSKAWIRLQDVMAWLYLYPVRGVTRLLPVNVLIWLTQRLAPLYARLRRDLAEPVSQHMARSFKGHEMPASAEIMARSYLARDLRKAMDDLVMNRLSTEALKRCATVRGMAFLDEVLAQGNGAIVISGHFHANRLAKYYLRRHGYSLMSIRNRVPLSVAMGRFGNRYVAPAYGRFLTTIVEDEIYTQDQGLGASLLRRLRENGIVNIQIDAGLSNERCLVSCLNEQREFACGFLRLADLTRAPLVPMQCLGNSSQFEIIFEQPIRYTGMPSPDEFTGRMESMAGLLESWVLNHPSEWVLWTGVKGAETIEYAG